MLEAADELHRRQLSEVGRPQPEPVPEPGLPVPLGALARLAVDLLELHPEVSLTALASALASGSLGGGSGGRASPFSSVKSKRTLPKSASMISSTSGERPSRVRMTQAR